MSVYRTVSEIFNVKNGVTLKPGIVIVQDHWKWLAISDERGRFLRVIKVRSHHAAPTPITLAESSMGDRLQAGPSGLQISSWPGTVIPCWRISSSNRFRVSKASAFRFVSWTVELSVPRTRLSTYGDRAFPVAAVRIWNSLPQHITSAPSLPVFCCHLKTYFFELCYP